MSSEEFFRRHAASYAVSPSHRAAEDLEALVEMLQPTAEDLVVDLAAGPGHTGLRLAPLAAAVVLVDLTPEMLVEARRIAQERGLSPVMVVADVAALPLLSSSCSIVTCRRAAHHFPDVDVFFAQALRVLEPGGRIGFADMTAEPAAIDMLNQMERIRDASHVEARTAEQWRSLLARHGFVDLRMVRTQERYTLQRWLSPVPRSEVDLDAIAARLRQSPAPVREALGLEERDGELTFFKRWVAIVGRKPA